MGVFAPFGCHLTLFQMRPQLDLSKDLTDGISGFTQGSLPHQRTTMSQEPWKSNNKNLKHFSNLKKPEDFQIL